MFPHKNDVKYELLQTTEEGVYSITRRRDADRIMNIIRYVVKHTDTKSITDCTACIGGDTLNFGLNFKAVISIELKQNNFDALRNNVDVYELHNVSTLLGDCTKLFDWYSDVVYIDPPWGGPDYREHKVLNLTISDIRLDAWLFEILLRKNRPAHIFLKLPVNYNFERFNTLPNVEFIKAYQIRNYVLVSIVVHVKRIHTPPARPDSRLQ